MIVILKKSPRLGGFLIALLSIFLFSCDYNKGKENIRATVTINDFAYYGNLHNEFMSNMIHNYKLTDEFRSVDDFFDDITSFNLQYAISHHPGLDSEQLSYLKKYDYFLDNDSFSRYCLSKATRSTPQDVESFINMGGIVNEDMPSLDAMLAYLHDAGFIDEHSFEITNRLLDLLIMSIEGLLSDANFERSIDGLINDFNTLCYPVDDPHSTPVGAVLAITKSSLAWWKENLDNAATDNKLPAVVVADAAGALTGFTIDAIVQTGKFIAGCADQWDWASSGFAALGGAIDGSIGISAKVGKGIATIIKGLK